MVVWEDVLAKSHPLNPARALSNIHIHVLDDKQMRINVCVCVNVCMCLCGIRGDELYRSYRFLHPCR